MVRARTRLILNAKAMRRSGTLAEQRIWSWLRGRRFSGYKFRRQYPIPPYILDFYCASLKLAIELDGEQHMTPWMNSYDSARTTYLQQRGIEVVRIPNVLLIRDALLVEEIIRSAIEQAAKKR